MKKYFIPFCLSVLLATTASAQQRYDGYQANQRLTQLEQTLGTLQQQVAQQSSAMGGQSGRLSAEMARVEEQMRQLSGQIEQLQHQIEQTQAHINRMQQDVELRFQQLTPPVQQPVAIDPATGAPIYAQPGSVPPPAAVMPPATAAGAVVAPPPAALPMTPPPVAPAAAVVPEPPASDPVIPIENMPAPVQGQADGKLEAELQSIIDQEPSAATVGNLASKPATGAPATSTELYNQGFAMLNQTDYTGAERLFTQFTHQFPKDPLIGNAWYWLGETYYVRRNYVKAADSFRQGFETLPDGPKAGDNLLKLAMSLAALKRDKEACVVLKQVDKKYSKNSSSLHEKARQEMNRLGCK